MDNGVSDPELVVYLGVVLMLVVLMLMLLVPVMLLEMLVGACSKWVMRSCVYWSQKPQALRVMLRV